MDGSSPDDRNAIAQYLIMLASFLSILLCATAFWGRASDERWFSLQPANYVARHAPRTFGDDITGVIWQKSQNFVLKLPFQASFAEP